MVITALTRNQVYGNVSWVRIPPLPPSKNDTVGVSFFAWSEVRDSNKICLQILIAFRKESCRGTPFRDTAIPPRFRFGVVFAWSEVRDSNKIACKFWSHSARNLAEGLPLGIRQYPTASVSVSIFIKLESRDSNKIAYNFGRIPLGILPRVSL